ncbi:MAG: alpha/beta fold hydrolase [Woeseiaceae bacterium]
MRVSKVHLIAAGLFCSLNVSANAEDFAPLEAYGELPVVGMMQLSPDGTRTVSRIAVDGRDFIAIRDVETNKIVGGANAERVNPRHLRFVNQQHVVLITSTAVRGGLGRGSFDYSMAYSMNAETSEVRMLLQRAKGLYERQGGLGRIVGRSPDGNTVFMPAFTGGGGGDAPYLSLLSVGLDGARERRIARGNKHTIDWFVDQNGVPIIREDFNDEDNVYKIWAVDGKGKEERLLYEEENKLLPFSLVGLTQERDALVIVARSSDTGVASYFLMSVEDGEISGPVLERDGLGVERVITDVNRVVYGVEFEGFLPQYEFFDEMLDKRVAAIKEMLPDTSVRLTSWSEDFSRLLVKVSGGWNSGAYVLFTGSESTPKTLARSRPAIDKEHVVPTRIIDYEAGDGRRIPALVTVREDVAAKGSAPLVVMPHGGPRSHDRFRFEWDVQYLASRGYAVLQPQFRGSDGFGNEHISAGAGEWGGKMQSDVDDGVNYLVEEGLADPERVCIVGASYGGYAALAAGAFSPGMYRCVVAIAPVSDLHRMMRRERSDHGRDHWVLDYWERLQGADLSQKDTLKSLSPAFHADAFTAPVLLLHGKKDTVVPIEQSKIMNKALKKAGKDVTFIQLKGEDHWLSQPDTRLETLRAIAAFIDEHL